MHVIIEMKEYEQMKGEIAKLEEQTMMDKKYREFLSESVTIRSLEADFSADALANRRLRTNATIPNETLLKMINYVCGNDPIVDNFIIVGK